MATITINGEEWTFGCYVDGHYGQYGIGRMMEVADDLLSNGETPYHDKYVELGGVDYEFLSDLADEVEAKMNELVPEGASFGWYDGEFFLWSTDDWEDD